MIILSQTQTNTVRYYINTDVSTTSMTATFTLGSIVKTVPVATKNGSFEITASEVATLTSTVGVAVVQINRGTTLVQTLHVPVEVRSSIVSTENLIAITIVGDCKNDDDVRITSYKLISSSSPKLFSKGISTLSLTTASTAVSMAFPQQTAGYARDIKVLVTVPTLASGETPQPISWNLTGNYVYTGSSEPLAALSAADSGKTYLYSFLDLPNGKVMATRELVVSPSA